MIFTKKHSFQKLVRKLTVSFLYAFNHFENHKMVIFTDLTYFMSSLFELIFILSIYFNINLFKNILKLYFYLFFTLKTIYYRVNQSFSQ